MHFHISSSPSRHVSRLSFSWWSTSRPDIRVGSLHFNRSNTGRIELSKGQRVIFVKLPTQLRIMGRVVLQRSTTHKWRPVRKRKKS